MVVAALAAGSVAGVKDTATAAVKDGYAALKHALSARFADRPAGQQALAELEHHPDTGPAELSVLVETLTAVGVDPDLQVLADRLQEALQQAGAGPLVQLNADKIQGVQVGNGNTQTNTFT